MLIFSFLFFFLVKKSPYIYLLTPPQRNILYHDVTRYQATYQKQQTTAAILKKFEKGAKTCQLPFSTSLLNMSQQGAALQTYNNELVKCKLLCNVA